MPVDPRSLDLLTLVALAGHAANAAVQARLATAGFEELRISDGYVIQSLLEHDPTITELADDLAITQQAASKLVADMEQRGLVVRTGDPSDRRVRRIVLSVRGRAAVDAARGSRLAVEAELGIPAEDLAVVRAALERLLDVTGGTTLVRGRRFPLPR
jgi:DNA-binding MarR family transcriptional regulator